MEGKFEEIKQEILRRAHEAEACKKQYGRAYKAEDMATLCAVIKDNFWWCCRKEVLTGALVEKYREEFAAQDIYVNVDVEKGFLLAWATPRFVHWATPRWRHGATPRFVHRTTLIARHIIP